MKKLLFILLLIITALVITAVCGLLKSWWFPPAPVIPASAAATPEKLFPGSPAEYRFTVTLPVTDKISDITVTGKNIIVSEPRTAMRRWLFDRIRWEISGSFRVLEPGEFTGGIVTFSDGKEKFRVALPDIQVELPPDDHNDELVLAPEFSGTASSTTERKPLILLITAAAAAVLIAAGILFLILRRKLRGALSPEERTIREIRRLNRAVQQNNIAVPAGFAMLCDQLRNYLEQRFGLPATRRTTEEFIREFFRQELQLPQQAKVFLTGFMERSDLIKFAAAQADKYMMDKAAAEAEELVRAAAPQLQEEKK